MEMGMRGEVTFGKNKIYDEDDTTAGKMAVRASRVVVAGLETG